MTPDNSQAVEIESDVNSQTVESESDVNSQKVERESDVNSQKAKNEYNITSSNSNVYTDTKSYEETEDVNQTQSVA
jgi:hypothetical protein